MVMRVGADARWHRLIRRRQVQVDQDERVAQIAPPWPAPEVPARGAARTRQLRVPGGAPVLAWGFSAPGLLFLILCGATLRPAWGREMFEILAHPATLCPAEASLAYRHDDNRRPACARRCGSVRLAFSSGSATRVPGPAWSAVYQRRLVIARGCGADGAGGRSAGPDAPGTASRARAGRVRPVCPLGVCAGPGAAAGGGYRARGSPL